MADDHLGPRQDSPAPWRKIFSAFKVALDFRNLLLAAAGVFVTSVGWWVLAILFYNSPFSARPEWKDYDRGDDKKAAWSRFQQARQKWNMLHELAGPIPSSPERAVRVDAADVSEDFDHFVQLSEIDQAYRRLNLPVRIVQSKDAVSLKVDETAKSYAITPVGDAAAALKKLEELADRLRVRDIVPGRDEAVEIAGVLVKVDQGFEELKKYRDSAETEADIQRKVARAQGADREIKERAWKTFQTMLKDPGIKAAGRLRTLPWFENRGPNPYLFVTGEIKQFGQDSAAKTRGQLVLWFLGQQAPVLLEPIVKFLKPVVYLFDQRAGFLNSIYLVLVLVWTLSTWGFFGGAICRIAAVQLCRGEKIPLAEAIVFARDKFLSLFCAPIVPLGMIGILAIVLAVIGAIAGLTWFVGDIFVYGLGYPLALVLGLVMAALVVGLVGWPLMNAVIGVEGSEAFDAISRSYSYIYQAPWQYAWYCLIAVVYGAVLVFFVGFMASLVVFLSKWSLALLPWLHSSDLAYNRDPTYLFLNAPTSFGWRDLLTFSHPEAVRRDVVDSSGLVLSNYELSSKYLASVSWSNSIGGFFVSIWLYVFFLLVVGFGYSYFWTVSTIIYLLMRKQVDETELDEVHMDDEHGNPFTAPPPPTSNLTVPPAEPKPGTISLTTIDAPKPVDPPKPAEPPPTADSSSGAGSSSSAPEAGKSEDPKP